MSEVTSIYKHCKQIFGYSMKYLKYKPTMLTNHNPLRSIRKKHLKNSGTFGSPFIRGDPYITPQNLV